MPEEGRTTRVLFHEAIRLYTEDGEWRSLPRFGQSRARDLGIGPGRLGAAVGQMPDRRLPRQNRSGSIAGQRDHELRDRLPASGSLRQGSPVTAGMRTCP